MPLPESFAPERAAEHVVRHEGFYDYRPVLSAPGAIEWHVNFADPHLFFAYGGPLFAQDEIQVAEHPILGSLREALQAYCATALTVEQGRPTPVLVAGVERRCHVATDPNPAEGRPRGLYGNEFGRAPAEVVRRATKRIEPRDDDEHHRDGRPVRRTWPVLGRADRPRPDDGLDGFSGSRARKRQRPGRDPHRLLGVRGVRRKPGPDGDAAGDRGRCCGRRPARLPRARRFGSRRPRLRPADDPEETLAARRSSSADLVRRIAAMGFEWGESDGN